MAAVAAWWIDETYDVCITESKLRVVMLPKLGLCLMERDCMEVCVSALLTSTQIAFTGQLHAPTSLLQGSSPSSTHGLGSSMGLKAVNAGIGEKISPTMKWTCYEPYNFIILSCPVAMEMIVIANIQSSLKRAS